MVGCRNAYCPFRFPPARRFCPFRFLRGDKAENDGSNITSREQPRPEIWGFGKRMCPGRELAKLEILLFLQMFLPRFDYDVVKGQVGWVVRLPAQVIAAIEFNVCGPCGSLQGCLDAHLPPTLYYRLLRCFFSPFLLNGFRRI